MKTAKDLSIQDIIDKMNEYWPGWQLQWADQADLRDLATGNLTITTLTYRLEQKINQVGHAICSLEEEDNG